MKTTVPAEKNRRQAVRVTDHLQLAVRLLSDEEFSDLKSKFDQGISLYNEEIMGEMAIYLGARGALTRIKEKDEDLAEYLLQIDTKMNRILQALQSGPSPLDNFRTVEVSISGSGLAFPWPESLANGSAVALNVILLPEQIHVYTIAKVVNSTKENEENYTIAVEYALLMDEDRENMIQHLFRCQQLALRNRRLQMEKNN
jgi:hypothetical protein